MGGPHILCIDGHNFMTCMSFGSDLIDHNAYRCEVD